MPSSPSPPPAQSALPLNVGSSSSGGGGGSSNANAAAPLHPRPSGSVTPRATQGTDISSPHELTAFVESLLSQLETRFDEMSGQVLDRMSAMSSRVDALEASISDLISGGLATPLLPQATGTSAMGDGSSNT